MARIENFVGNRAVLDTLEQMLHSDRIPQTILLHGGEGVGKATLARRFAGLLLGDMAKIEQDDLSHESNMNLVAEREKLAAEKRNEDPFFLSSHPDFVTFPPDGPLRQISIPQMRLLKERAQLHPLKGSRRIFLIDQIDRANEQAANSLLKTLEEPPDHLILILTARNPFDLLPTIRSRAVILALNPVPVAELQAFLERHGADFPVRRAALAQGSPGLALKLDLVQYDARRNAMLKLLRSASGQATFGDWAAQAEAMGRERSEKLDDLLPVLYTLLEDVLLLQQGASWIRNTDIRPALEPIARSVSFEWLRAAVEKTNELSEFARRNIQKIPALDAMTVGLRKIHRAHSK